MDLPITRFIEKYTPSTNRFIKESLDFGGKVFVHCKAGISRAATVCIAFLMWDQHMSVGNAYSLVKGKRLTVQPNDRVLEQLTVFEKQLNESKDDDGKVQETGVSDAST